MNYPVCRIDACSHDQLSKHTPVLNKATIDYFIWIYLDPELCRDLHIFQVEDITAESVELPVTGFIERTSSCWLKITSSILDQSPGQHVCKISMVNRITHDVVNQYFSYIIQDDNPDKPYVYMNVENASGCQSCCQCCNNKV